MTIPFFRKYILFKDSLNHKAIGLSIEDLANWYIGEAEENREKFEKLGLTHNFHLRTNANSAVYKNSIVENGLLIDANGGTYKIQFPQNSKQVPQVSNQSPQVSNQSAQVSNQSKQISNQIPQKSSQSPQISLQAPQKSLLWLKY